MVDAPRFIEPTRDEVQSSSLLPFLVPRTKSGLAVLAVVRSEAAELVGCSVDTLERIPFSELPVIPGRPCRYLLSDLVLYLERKRRVA